MPMTLESLLDTLGPDRRPVAELWRALGVERRELQQFIAEHRDALAQAGAQLHIATASQAAAPRLHLEIDGRRYAALSLPVVEAEQPAPLARVEPAALARPALGAAAQAADTAAARGALARYRAGLAEQTRRAQDADLSRWARYLAAVGVAGAGCAWAEDAACWADVSWGLVEGFIAWQQAEGYAAATVARALSTVRSYAQQAARAGALAPDALRLIETVEAPAARSRAARNVDAQRDQTRRGAKKAEAVKVSPAQLRALKREHSDTPAGRRDALLMCLLIDHGLRISEAIDLQVSALDLAESRMTFYRRKVNKEQTHKLSPDTLRAARRYYTAGDAPAAGQLLRATLTTGSDELDGPISVQSARRRVELLGRRAGVEGLSPHDLRHAWATRAAQAGADPFALQEAGGWSSLTMPRRYVEAAQVANDKLGFVDQEEDD